MGGDYRIFGFENSNSFIRNLFFDFEYHAVLEKYCGTKIYPCTVLGGMLRKIDGRVTNSGGSWHRDPPAKLPYRRVKAIIYLTDVTTNNGPFTFIPNTRYTDLKDDNTMLRVSDQFVKKLDRRFDKKPIEFTATAGTMIIADITNIHRGKPLIEGSRYSLTCYFKNNFKSSESFKRSLIKKNYLITKN